MPTETQLAERPKREREVHPVLSVLMSPKTKEALQLIAPKIDPDEIMAKARLLVTEKPELLECTPGSILLSLKKSVACGLELNGRDAHIVAYNKKQGDGSWAKEAQFQADYKGLIRLAKTRLPLIRAELVRENDEFSVWSDDDGPHMLHRFDVRRDRGKVIGAFSMTKDTDGNVDVEWMSVAELDAIEARSKSKDRSGNAFGPWKTDQDEMRKKTVLRRHSKRWDISPELRRAFEADDEHLALPSAPSVKTSRILLPPGDEPKSLPEPEQAATEPEAPEDIEKAADQQF